MMMKCFRKFGLVMVIALTAIAGAELGDRLSVPGIHSFIASAEAKVGRPLTPVSVAGATRRTVRRCAAGVYNC
jgi:hypothetical protein